MAFSLLTVGGRRISIALHTKRAPSDDEWRDWIALLDQVGPEVQWDLARAPNLVFTDGGAPDTSQRTAVNMRVAQGKTLPAVAVVTQSMLVRVMARGFSIFNPSVRVFAPEDLDGAVAHVGFAPRDARELLSAAINLEGKVLGAGAVETLSAVTRTRG